MTTLMHEAKQGPESHRLEITSETVHLSAVRRAVEEATREAGLPEQAVSGVALAIDEAITNIIRHGYRGETGRPIEIEFGRATVEDRPSLEFRLSDRGQQVDPDQIAGRDLSDVRPGGLGTHIIRSVMDRVEYARREGGGMQLRMVKFMDSDRTEQNAGGSDRGATHAG